MCERWREVALGDVATVYAGGTPKTGVPDYWGGDIQWITPTDLTALSESVIDGGARRITDRGLRESSARIAPAGSVLVTSRATIGVTAIAGREVAVNQGVTVLVPGDGVDKRWLYYWVHHAKPEMLARASGTTFLEISRSKMRELSVILPSLEEQRRIGDLLASVDETRALAEAEVDAAQSLIRRLRSRLIAESGSPRVALSELVQVTMGRQRSPKHRTGDHIVPYLRAGNVKDGVLALDDVLSMNFMPAEQEKYALVPGDVLVTEGCGSLSQIGANAVWRGEVEGTVCFQNTLLRLRAIEGKTIPSFVAQWARFAFESGLFAEVSSGTSIFHVGAERAAKMPLPAIPVKDQAAVARVLDQGDVIVRGARARLVALDDIRGSVLSVLFSGAHEIPESYDQLLAESRAGAEPEAVTV